MDKTFCDIDLCGFNCAKIVLRLSLRRTQNPVTGQSFIVYRKTFIPGMASCFFCLLLVLLTGGCDSPAYQGSHFWIFIPTNMTMQEAPISGYPAEVLLPVQPFTTNRIQVEIRGEVVSPGTVSVPQGSTVLQAIGHAGGFKAFARGRVTVSHADGTRTQLSRKSKVLNKRRQVWFEVQANTSSTSTQRTDSPPTDFVIQDGDSILIPRAVW